MADEEQDPGTKEEHEDICHGGTSEGGRPMARPGRASADEKEKENDQEMIRNTHTKHATDRMGRIRPNNS